MTAWLLRSVGMTAVHVVLRLLLGVWVTTAPLQGTVARWTMFALVLLVALVWAAADGIADTRRNPLVEDRTDLVARWMIAALITGLAAGLICWLADKAGADGLGSGGLVFDLTSGAAGTALMVIVPAALGIGVGRFIGGRGSDDEDYFDETIEQVEDERLAVGSD